MSTLDTRLQALLDEREIRGVIEAYVHACDRGDRDAVADVYWPDSWDDHGPLKCAGPEFADRVVQSLTAWKTCSHLLGQSRIHVDGDNAGGETLFLANLTRDGEDGRPFLDLMSGRYIDRFERRAGEWKIKDRRCISEWTSSTPLGEDHLAGRLFVQGERSPRDVSYDVLGLSAGRARLPA